MASGMTVPTFHPEPHIEKGVSYWQTVPATVDGVLGGYGNGTLPIVDAQGSRSYLLEMLPRLQAVTPASADAPPSSSSSSSSSPPKTWVQERIAARGGPGRAVTRALDCGAGVGRVTRDALSRIIDIVHLVEPVESFLDEAKRASTTTWPAMQAPPSKTPLQARKAAHFHLCTLQAFDPARPYTSAAAWGKGQRGVQCIERAPTLSPEDDAAGAAGIGAIEAAARDEPFAYDVIWGQWCLQHLSDKDLVSFLQRAQQCLRKPTQTLAAQDAQRGAVLDGAGIIVVKENVLRDAADGSERVWYDDEDHSITRTPNAYERCFRQAGLEIVDGRLQRGLPEELFPVMMWCLRVPVAGG